LAIETCRTEKNTSKQRGCGKELVLNRLENFFGQSPGWERPAIAKATPCFAIRFAVRAGGNCAGTDDVLLWLQLLPRLAHARSYFGPGQRSNVVRYEVLL